MGIIGQSVTRVDAPDKVTGRAKYTDDIADKSALIAKVLHSSIAHGYVKSIDKRGGKDKGRGENSHLL